MFHPQPRLQTKTSLYFMVSFISFKKTDRNANMHIRFGHSKERLPGELSHVFPGVCVITHSELNSTTLITLLDIWQTKVLHFATIAKPAFRWVPPEYLPSWQDLCRLWCATVNCSISSGLAGVAQSALFFSFFDRLPTTFSLFPLTLFVFAAFSCTVSSRPLLCTPPLPWNQLLGNQLQRLPEKVDNLPAVPQQPSATPDSEARYIIN